MRPPPLEASQYSHPGWIREAAKPPAFMGGETLVADAELSAAAVRGTTGAARRTARPAAVAPARRGLGRPLRAATRAGLGRSRLVAGSGASSPSPPLRAIRLVRPRRGLLRSGCLALRGSSRRLTASLSAALASTPASSLLGRRTVIRDRGFAGCALCRRRTPRAICTRLSRCAHTPSCARPWLGRVAEGHHFAYRRRRPVFFFGGLLSARFTAPLLFEIRVVDQGQHLVRVGLAFGGPVVPP